MRISKIKLLNFRNYEKTTISFGKKMNIFVGDNAQGKTNILESIYILALTKSHRNGVENNLIRFGCEKAKIEGSVRIGKLIRDLEVSFTLKEKKVRVNETEIKKISDYISNLNVILFTPDDLDIVKGSPNIRRNLLNIQISQISNNYINIYNEYNRILKTRNEYLKILYVNHIADMEYFDVLTQKLIEKAVIIYQKRFEYLTKVNDQLDFIYQFITGRSGLHLLYQPNISIENYTKEEIQEKLSKKLKENYKRELLQGTTLYGPHRDDFAYFLNDIDLKLYGSQGQQRLAIVAHKLSEISIFEEATNTKPILLLDDIFSEIDRKKKNKLLEFIDQDIQSIITTTDLKDVNKKALENATVFKVTKGTLEKKVGRNNGRSEK